MACNAAENNSKEMKPLPLDTLLDELEAGAIELETRIDFWLDRTGAELGALMLRNQIRANITFDPLFLYDD